jgi:hypothetical protein
MAAAGSVKPKTPPGLVTTGAPEEVRPEMSPYMSMQYWDGSLGEQYAVSPGSAVSGNTVAFDPVAAGKVKAGTAAVSKVKAGSVKAGQLDTKKLGADTRATDAMRDRALAKGDSPWLKMQMKRQGIEETAARDAAAQQALSGAATARSQLAMRGGLGSGASQRVAMQAGRDMNAARQAAGRAGQLDRLGLQIADDQTKTSLLGQTAGLDLAHAQQGQDMAKFNVGTALDASKFNTGLAYDASKTNAANKMDISKFNTGLAYDASKTNVANKLDASKFNSLGGLDASKFNSAQDYDAQKFNSSQEFDANKMNTGTKIASLQGQNAFNMDKYKQDMMGYAAGKSAAAIGSGGKK